MPCGGVVKWVVRSEKNWFADDRGTLHRPQRYDPSPVRDKPYLSKGSNRLKIVGAELVSEPQAIEGTGSVGVYPLDKHATLLI